MRKTFCFEWTKAVFVLLMTLIISGCSKQNNKFDIHGDAVNRVFVNTQTSIMNNYDFAIVHTPVNSVGDIEAKFPVKSTLKSDEEIEVTFEVDNSLIDSYNTENSTDFHAIPDGMVQLSNNMLRIPKGASISTDSVEVNIPANDLSSLKEPGYIIPIKISKISQSNKTAISSNMNTVFLRVMTSNTNVYNSPVASDMTGNLISNRSAWTATLNTTVNSGSLPAMFDGNTRSYWFISPSKECILTVDLGKMYENITGIRINSYSTTYSLLSASVASSGDGDNWVSQGNAQFSTANTYQYIKFYAPINTRYLSLDITGWRSASNIVVAEFDVYAE